MNLIEADNILKVYDGFRLGPLSISLPEGCVTGLIAENGAGKSTLIKLVSGCIKRDGGECCVLGRDSAQLGSLKEEIGLVADDSGFPDPLTAGLVDRMMSGIFKNWDSGEFERICRLLDVPQDKEYAEMSSGNKMKLKIAATLGHRPRLLLLDEPMNGLDPAVRDRVVELLFDFTRDESRGVLISSHIVTDLERLCDYICFMKNGQVILHDEKDRLLERYGILRCPRSRLNELGGAVAGFRSTEFGVEALADRKKLPRGTEVSPVSLEELFVIMINSAEKEGQK